MPIKTIPLSQLEADPRKTLNDAADAGQTLVVQLSDQRLVAIQPLEATEDDSLIDELLATNPEFRAVVSKSKSSERKPFIPQR